MNKKARDHGPVGLVGGFGRVDDGAYGYVALVVHDVFDCNGLSTVSPTDQDNNGVGWNGRDVELAQYKLHFFERRKLCAVNHAGGTYGSP